MFIDDPCESRATERYSGCATSDDVGFVWIVCDCV